MSTEYLHDEVEQTIDQFINEHFEWVLIIIGTIIVGFIVFVYFCINCGLDVILCIPRCFSKLLKCIYDICSCRCLNWCNGCCRCFRCCFDYDPV